MPASQLLSQRHFSAIIIASLIAGVAFFDFAIFLYLSDLLLNIFLAIQSTRGFLVFSYLGYLRQAILPDP